MFAVGAVVIFLDDYYFFLVYSGCKALDVIGRTGGIVSVFDHIESASSALTVNEIVLCGTGFDSAVLVEFPGKALFAVAEIVNRTGEKLIVSVCGNGSGAVSIEINYFFGISYFTVHAELSAASFRSVAVFHDYRGQLNTI